MTGYPYSWWNSFLQNYDALQKIRSSAPQQYQAAIASLLRSGGTIYNDATSGITVSDSDAQQWLYSTHQLAQRMGNVPLEQSTATGMETPTGMLPDAYSYYGPELQTIADALPSWETVGEIVITLVLGVAAIVIVPPLIQAIAGRK